MRLLTASGPCAESRQRCRQSARELGSATPPRPEAPGQKQQAAALVPAKALIRHLYWCKRLLGQQSSLSKNGNSAEACVRVGGWPHALSGPPFSKQSNNESSREFGHVSGRDPISEFKSNMGQIRG